MNKKETITAITLMLIAFYLLSAVWYIFLLMGVIYYSLKGKLDEYLYGIAINLDFLFGGLLFGTISVPMSSTAHRRFPKLEKVINWIFRDDKHCKNSALRDGNRVRRSK